MQPDTASVVVVGAGLSGLIAARELDRRGVDVVVLEAAPRVGGRTLTETSLLGSRLDLGGQWIGHDHARLRKLADELDAPYFQMHTGLLPTVADGPRRVRLASPTMAAAVVSLAAAQALTALPTPARRSTATLEESLRRVPGAKTRRLLEVIARVSWTADPEQLSVATALDMIRRQGGLLTMLSTRGGAQDSLLVGGAGSLSERIAADLGAKVVTGARVTSIARDDDGATVRTALGDVRADAVIVTAPPPVAAQIAHEPPLPPERVALEANTFMGSVYKAIAVYDRPFWRTRGGGEFLTLHHPGGGVFDTSAPDGPGHLCTLLGGSDARALDGLDPDARRDAVLRPLVPHVGPEVLEPASWHEKSWHLDEFVGGGYMALPKAGTTDGHYPMAAAPIGRLHWAGTETATEHPGYLDGAIEAGLRAAGEVDAQLHAAQ